MDENIGENTEGIDYQNTSEDQETLGSDSDDYYRSDEEDLSDVLSFGNAGRFHQSTSLQNHATYLNNSLSGALESTDLDRSLVLLAQLSGNLNNEEQILHTKNEELVRKLEHLTQMYRNLVRVEYDNELKMKCNRIDRLRKKLNLTEKRVENLKTGRKSDFSLSKIFKSKDNISVGFAQKFPIEYNQAKDKVMDSQFVPEEDNIL